MIRAIWALIACATALTACGGGGSSTYGRNAPAAPTYVAGPLVPPIAQSGARGMKSYKIKGKRYYPRDDPGYRQRGTASWYGPKFHGRLTANGERYNQWALTAAHKTVPLGSYLKVTNLENGRNVTLLVNDRGPFVSGRIVDVSRRGADILGMIKAGTARVLVERTDRYGRTLGKQPRVRQVKQTPITPTWRKPAAPAQVTPAAAAPKPAIAPPPQGPAGPVMVQVGSFSDFYNARRLQQSVASVGPAAIKQITIEGGDIRYRVQVGPYADPLAAEQALNSIHQLGHTGATLRGLDAVETTSR
ncbi:MAG: septal ring lytic transglycosylase RlpA family protein [Pseudomonadota bacterium]